MMKNSVLVTGASGFVGRSLLRSLEREDYPVIPLVRSPKKLPNEVVLDFTDDDFPRKIQELPPVDAVIHLGAKIDWDASKSKLFLPNVLATANLVNWARSAGAQFIFASTITVCGAHTPAIKKDTKTNLDTNYGYSKWLSEELIKMSGVEHLILRISGIYGRNGPRHLGINKAIDHAIRGDPPRTVR